MNESPQEEEMMEVLPESREDDLPIRAKGVLDGARTLEEAAQFLRDLADRFIALQGQGWELVQPVEDDYGFIRKGDG